jgi:octaprenyl-diphosphate synthase
MSQNDPILKLQKLLSHKLGLMDQLFSKMMESDSAPRIPEITKHIFESGGKKIRPLLCIATAEALNYKLDKHILLAATIEFIHTATLLHDDVVDESSTRRGEKTANILWDNKSSILVGDFLFSRAFQLMVATKSLSILEVLSNAAAIIAESEVLQLTNIKNINIGLETYFKIIEGKTAELFSAACETGAMIATSNLNQIKSFKSYGKSIGICFQLIDDYLDYKGDKKIMGKLIGNDFFNSKLTYPIIITLNEGTYSEKEKIENLFKKKQKTQNDLKLILEILDNNDALKKTKIEAIKWSKKAKEEIQKIPQNPITILLQELADSIISRSS